MAARLPSAINLTGAISAGFSSSGKVTAG